MTGRAVPDSEPWPFRSHRAMSQVIRDETVVVATDGARREAGVSNLSGGPA